MKHTDEPCLIDLWLWVSHPDSAPAISETAAVFLFGEKEKPYSDLGPKRFPASLSKSSKNR